MMQADLRFHRSTRRMRERESSGEIRLVARRSMSRAQLERRYPNCETSHWTAGIVAMHHPRLCGDSA